MKLKYPISYEVAKSGLGWAQSGKLYLASSFSEWAFACGIGAKRASSTASLKKAVRMAKKHGGSVIAFWLEDKPSKNGVGRNITYGQKVVFGPALGIDRNHDNAPLECFAGHQSNS